MAIRVNELEIYTDAPAVEFWQRNVLWRLFDVGDKSTAAKWPDIIYADHCIFAHFFPDGFSSTVSSISPTPTAVEPNFKRPAYCQKYSFGKTDFLKMLSNIIDHGDLHDLEFTEKVLGTKLSLQFVNDSNGQNTVYRSNWVRGYPISVIVGLDKIYKFTGEKKNSYVSFESNSPPSKADFFTECIRLVTSDFSNHFGAGFFVGIPVGNVPTPDSSYSFPEFLSASKEFISSNGKKSQFGISINYDTGSLVVDSVGIGQQN